MITWATPAAFLLLIFVAALPWQPRLTGVLRLAVPGPNQLKSTPTARSLLAWLPLLLQMAGWTLLIIALARPQLKERTTLVSSEGLDIILAVDTSGSMNSEDFTVRGLATDRLSAAKGVLSQFVEGRPNDRVGIVVFGEYAFTQVPLTLDHPSLQRSLSEIQIGVAGENRTAIGDAIAISTQRLKDLEAPSKVLILLTDGNSNHGKLTPLEASKYAGELGIKIYTIGIGSRGRSGFFGLRSDGLDTETLTKVATQTGGRFFEAVNTTKLREVYAAIDELEPSPAEVEELVKETELFRTPLGFGLGFLVLHALLSATWLRRWP